MYQLRWNEASNLSANGDRSGLSRRCLEMRTPAETCLTVLGFVLTSVFAILCRILKLGQMLPSSEMGPDSQGLKVMNRLIENTDLGQSIFTRDWWPSSPSLD